MKIAHIAAEMSPFAKVGGLGDVVQGLCRALVKLDHRVEIILPKYDAIGTGVIAHLSPLEEKFLVTFDEKDIPFTVWSGKYDGVNLTLIDAPYFFERENIYGYDDDCDRFLYFSLAALTYLIKRESAELPDVLHLHDWHSAAAILLLKHHPDLISKIKTLLTIHNLAYLGTCSHEDLKKVSLATSKKVVHLLEEGILGADFITTVSPTYAKEIITDKSPSSVTNALRKRLSHFQGVLNGIDYNYWNPQTDPCLKHVFSQEDLSGKKAIKKEVQDLYRLAREDVPLVSAITRLVPQKGPELIREALFATLDSGGQFVLLGSALDPQIEDNFKALKSRFQNNRNVHLELAYKEEVSHLLYAASDLLVIPSLFEPCGLTQMIAMRYGALPLVRETGGLADTVKDGINGFSFLLPKQDALRTTLQRAFSCWVNQEQWKIMQGEAMKTDFSWDKPALEYQKIYRGLQARIR